MLEIQGIRKVLCCAKLKLICRLKGKKRPKAELTSYVCNWTESVALVKENLPNGRSDHPVSVLANRKQRKGIDSMTPLPYVDFFQPVRDADSSLNEKFEWPFWIGKYKFQCQLWDFLSLQFKI